MLFPKQTEFSRSHFDIAKNSSQSSSTQGRRPMHWGGRTERFLNKDMMTSANTGYAITLQVRNRTISAPVGRGNLGMRRVGELKIERA